MEISPSADAIVRVLEAHPGERHLIALQDYPDPDAIASAVAHRRLSARLGIQADIAYAGAVSHHQNRALVSMLAAGLIHVSALTGLSSYDAAVFLDNQGATNRYLTRLLAAARVAPLLVVDHHPVQRELIARHQVLEPGGTTSSLYADLLLRGQLDLPIGSPAGRRLATALLLGILTDTGDLLMATSIDRRAARELRSWSDAELLRRIVEQPAPKETAVVFSRAMRTRRTVLGFSIAGVGYLDAVDRDALAQAADFLLSSSDTQTAVVYGILRDWRGREALVGSLRTADPSFDPEAFFESALGLDYRGLPFGGGRPFAGAFEIPIGFSSRLESFGYQSARWAYYDLFAAQRLLAAARRAPDELIPQSFRHEASSPSEYHDHPTRAGVDIDLQGSRDKTIPSPR